MRFGKVMRLTTLMSLAAALAIPASVTSGAHAGSLTQTDKSGDTIDYIKHPQNSFRPPIPWTTYQYSSTPSQDIQSYTLDAGSNKPGYFTARMQLGGRVPHNGDPITAMPPGFVSMIYAWYFQTNFQDTKQQISTDCVPVANAAYPVDSGAQDTVVAGNVTTTTFTSTSTCNKYADSAHENNLDSSGSSPTSVTQRNATYEVAHPRGDGWWMLFSVETDIVSYTPATPCPGGTGSTCLWNTTHWGIYEGYSGFSTTLNCTPGDENVNVSTHQCEAPSEYAGSNTIQVRVPYDPMISNNDFDGIVDDTQLWPTKFGGSGGTVQAVVAISEGVVQVGTDNVCTVVDGATGGTDCHDLIGGAGYGLLVVRDWAPDGGFELRQVPRGQSYLPNTTNPQQGLTCRYPVGSFPAPPAPLEVPPAPSDVSTGQSGAASGQAGASVVVRVPGSIGADTTPYTRAWWIDPHTDDPTLGGVINNHKTAAPTLPGATTVALPTGRDNACGYAQNPTGLHYFPITTAFPMA